MLRSILFSFILLISTFSFAQNKEVRSIDAYNAISVKGSFHVELIQSDKEEIVLMGPADVTSKIETNKTDKKVTIKPEKGLKRYNPITIKIYFKSLNEVGMYGSGDVHTTNTLNTENFKFDSRGSGDAKFDIECKTLDVSMSGSGEFTAMGKASTFSIKSFGSGNVRAFDLTTETITLESKGSGDLSIHATGSVTGENFGSGDIECMGGASIDIKNQGSGSVQTR